MKELEDACKSLKLGFTPRKRDPRRPVAYWSEKDTLNNTIVNAFVIVLYTRGCSWTFHSGCTMCGYFSDSRWGTVTAQQLQDQFDYAMQHYTDEPVVKIFTSGSFLDGQEVPVQARETILSVLKQKTEKISVESRPTYITSKKIQKIRASVKPKTFEIGIGLETANDFVREYAINKGFTFEDYKKAATILTRHQAKLKTYVFLKPLFLTEKEAIKDCITTIDNIQRYTDSVSLNPASVQRFTLMEYLWQRNQYRPPWLWSIVDVLKTSKKRTPNTMVKCDVVGGGKIRGPHNCQRCDQRFLDAIKKFSLTQDTKSFKNLACDCKEQWLDQLDLEHLSFGSLIDTAR